MLATIKDVARQAGVSVSTASIALSGKGPVSAGTLEKVREAAEALGYRPNRVARSLVTRRTYSVGLVVADLRDPYFHGIAKGVEERLSASGYTVVLADTDRIADKLRRSLEVFLSCQVDGLIIAGSGDDNDASLARLAEGNVPVVGVGSYGVDLPVVTVDNRKATRLVVEHLVRQGRRRIGYVGGLAGLHVSKEREEGFREAMSRYGLTPALWMEGDFTPVGGYRSLLAAWEARSEGTERPDAIVAANDQMAIGIMKALRTIGLRIPNDVAVTGVGDIDTAIYLEPTLTTVSLPLREMGRRAAGILLDMIESAPGAWRPRSISLDVTLQVRNSSAAASLTTGA